MQLEKNGVSSVFKMDEMLYFTCSALKCPHYFVDSG